MTVTRARSRRNTVLPRRVRLPDLSEVRHVTPTDLDGLLTRARHAIDWGPDRRNGYRRHLTMAGARHWTCGEDGYGSPDPNTPGRWYAIETGWYRNGRQHRDGDQPALIAVDCIAWFQDGARHRPHAPAVISGLSRTWAWHGTFASAPVADLLTRVWNEQQPLSDDGVLRLLDRADHVPADPGTPTPPAWLAHVLLARPEAGTWHGDTGAWLALLTA